MIYRERPTAVPGVVLWSGTVGPAPERRRILPDGCLDLVWDGRRLFLAGPDTSARWHQSYAGASYVALRCAGGTGPALLGVSADAVRDETPDLDQVWPVGEAHALTERVAANPVATLDRWALDRAATSTVDPLGPRVLSMAVAGTAVASMADRVGLSARQLHRRCLRLFGYGPRRLARVLRLGRAIDESRAGTPLAHVAARCGYADQAHLARETRALAGATPTELARELARR